MKDFLVGQSRVVGSQDASAIGTFVRSERGEVDLLVGETRPLRSARVPQPREPKNSFDQRQEEEREGQGSKDDEKVARQR